MKATKKPPLPLPNPVNFRRVSECTPDEIKILFEKSTDFAESARLLHWDSDARYYTEDIVRCFENSVECAYYGPFEEVHLELVDYGGICKAKICAKFIAGLRKAQEDFCFLPINMVYKLEFLEMLESNWADAPDDWEYEEGIESVLVTETKNMLMFVEHLINHELMDSDTPEYVLNWTLDMYDSLFPDDLFYDTRTWELFTIRRFNGEGLIR